MANKIKKTFGKMGSGIQPLITADLLKNPWRNFLLPEFKQNYMSALEQFLQDQIKKKKALFPKIENIFLALNLTSLENVKVVILGQDPYHGNGQAHGLAFSVPKGIVLPPSLKNIFSELHKDLSIALPTSGDLTSWAKEGVLLLNTVLTVEEGHAASHQGKGWEIFTDAVIKLVSHRQERVVFILWGAKAQKKESMIDSKKHLILKSAHPSPLSVYRGFTGSRPFSKANKYLQQHSIGAVNWKL